jgi:hypothetical protein
LLIIPLFNIASGDGTFFYDRNKFDIYEPGQNAICAWNGKEEIMILSVDVQSSTEDTKIVHVIPFPSKPTYSLVEDNVFEKINWYKVEDRGYESNVPDYWEAFEEYEMNAPNDIDIISHEKIGPHNITVAYVSRSHQFQDWANKYFKSHGLKDISLPEETSNVINHYLIKGYNYFVFDIIDIKNRWQSVEPLAYHFKTDVLYYPLKITSLLDGQTTIDLAFITPSSSLLNYKKLDYLKFGRMSSNKWSNESLKRFYSPMGELFDDDLILDHYRMEYVSTEDLTDDVELQMMEPIWVKTDDHYIHRPQIADFNGDGEKELLYFNIDGIFLVNPQNGEPIWIATTSGHVNDGDVSYIDVTNDEILEMFVYSNYGIYLIDMKTGEKLIEHKISRMQACLFLDNDTILIFDEYTICKIDLASKKVVWENCLDRSFNYHDFYDFVRIMSGLYPWDFHYFRPGSYEYNISVYCYNLFYHPFKHSSLQGVDIDNDSKKEFAIIFQNSTCLLDSDTGELIWKTTFFNQSTFWTQSYYDEDFWTSISFIEDSDNDTIMEVKVNTDFGEYIFSGRNGTILFNESKDPFFSRASDEINQSEPLPFEGSKYEIELDYDGLKDYVLVSSKRLESEFELEYSLYYSSKDTWTDEKSIKLHGSHHIFGVILKNSTLILHLPGKVIGIDIDINELIWELDIGLGFRAVECLNIDNDSQNELVLVTYNRIIGMDFPSKPIPSTGNVTSDIGPFYYNDEKTPIEDGVVYLENNDGLIFMTVTNDSGQSLFKIKPGKYRVIVNKEDSTYIDYFLINVTDSGFIIYETMNGEIPVSSKSPPKDDDENENITFSYISIILVILIFIIFIVAIYIKKSKIKIS